MSNNVTSDNTNTALTSNIQPGNRISWLDILRGIGILLMVYGHINYKIPVYNWIYSFHMPLFFFAAGVVYKSHPVIKDILHRALTILVPYIFYGIITLLYWYFAERHYKPSDLTFFEAAKGILIGNEDALDFNIPLWFLPCFFLTLVLYNIFRRMLEGIAKNAPAGVKQFFSFVFCIGLSLIYSFDLLETLPWGIDRIPKYILFVSLGEIASNVLTRKPIILRRETLVRGVTSILSRIVGFVVAIPLLISSIMLSSKLNYTEVRYQWFIVSILGCAFVVTLSIAISHSRILEFCGQSALLILCIHGPVYRAIIYALTNITDKTMEWLRTTPVVIAAISLVTIILCLLIRRVMLIPLRKQNR